MRPSVYFKMISVRQRRERRVRFGLIPECDRRNVIRKRQIPAAALPSQVLNRYAQIIFEADRIGNVPAIEPESLLRLIQAVGLDDLCQAGVGRGEGVVLVRLLILKIIRPVEVIFGSRAVDCRKYPVAVEVKLDFALTPPTVVVDAPGQISAYILSFAFDAIQDRI